MESTIRIPKQLMNDTIQFPSFVVDENNRPVLLVHSVDHKPEIKEEIMKRYNNYPAIKTIAIVTTLISVVSLLTLLIL